MKYILNEEEYQDYQSLKGDWKKKATDILMERLMNELVELKKKKIKKAYFSEWEIEFFMSDFNFVNISEYGNPQAIEKDEVGTLLGVKILEFKRAGRGFKKK